MSTQLSQEQIHTLTAYGYYYDWEVDNDIFIGRSILNGFKWRIVARGNNVFDVYVQQNYSEWKKLRSVIDVASTYAVLNDYEDVWCKHHPVLKRWT